MAKQKKPDAARPIGEQIRQLRVASGRSVSELAVAAGLNPQTLYRIEQGREASYASIAALLGALGREVRVAGRVSRLSDPKPKRRTP